jgi:hypothetical protein
MDSGPSLKSGCRLCRRIAFDDRRLERLMAKLRYLQPHLADLGLQVALVVTGAGIAAGRAALVTLGVAQPIRLRIQKRVQRLLHAADSV